MIYYFDIDGTICNITDGNYSNAQPIKERINKINELYEDGNKIFLYTARGSQTGIDWTQETKRQLAEWGIKYHDVSLGKPHYDLWVDDKAVSDKLFFSDDTEKTVETDTKFVSKGWGFEKWIVNCDEYCGKLLYFVKGGCCSWHYHILKDEVFYIQSGKILVKYSDRDDLNSAREKILTRGDSFHVYRGLRHQMIALEDTELFEFSTTHYDTDSRRLQKGD